MINRKKTCEDGGQDSRALLGGADEARDLIACHDKDNDA